VKVQRWTVALGLTAGFIVALGTYEPLVEAATSGDRVSVAGRHFALTTAPVAACAAAVLTLRMPRRSTRGHMARSVVVVLGAAVAVAALPTGREPFAVVIALAAGAAAGRNW